MRYVLKDLSINIEARTVHRDGTLIKLPDLSFDVLAKLIEAAPQPVSIAAFSNEVWRTEYVSDETVAQRIALLRKALGDDSKAPVYIRTVRSLGYALARSVAPIENKPAPKGVTFFNRRKSVAVGVGLFGLMLVPALLLSFRSIDSRPAQAVTVADTTPASAITILVDRAQQQLSLHQAQGTDRAIAMLREALTQDPTHFDTRLTLSFALSTKATKFGGDSGEAEAEAIARTLINERPDSSDAWSALGYALGAQGRMNESLPAYQYAYQLNPNNASAMSRAAYLYLLRGELHQALSLEFRARQAGGMSRYAEIQIAQSLELIDHPAAAAWYAKALSLNPGQVVILSVTAKSHLRRGNPQAALNTLAQAEGEDQFAPQILQLRARASISMGRIEEARRILATAGWRGHYDLAALDAIAGDPSAAEAFLLPSSLASHATDPDPMMRIQLAEVTAALGRNEEALQFLMQAINLGWRDALWMKQSPFLGDLMSSGEGRELESRIERELDAQRRLIEGAEELMLAISG